MEYWNAFVRLSRTVGMGGHFNMSEMESTIRLFDIEDKMLFVDCMQALRSKQLELIADGNRD